MRRLRERLEDIEEAIKLIKDEAAAGKAVFVDDRKLQVWIVYHLQIIGEAARANRDTLKRLAPETPWDQVVGMRHILTHDYFGIDLDEVWAVVERDLAPLQASVERLLASSDVP